MQFSKFVQFSPFVIVRLNIYCILEKTKICFLILNVYGYVWCVCMYVAFVGICYNKTMKIV